MKHDDDAADDARFIITARLLLVDLVVLVLLLSAVVVAFDCSHFRMVDRALRRLQLFFDNIIMGASL